MKDHNLATNSTSNKQQLSNLKQKHRIEIDKLTSNHTSELEKLGQQHTLELSQQKKKRENMRQKNMAQKTAAASMQTVEQVQFKLQELHLNYETIVDNHTKLEISNGQLEKKVSDLLAAAPIDMDFNNGTAGTMYSSGCYCS